MGLGVTYKTENKRKKHSFIVVCSEGEWDLRFNSLWGILSILER